MTAGEVLAAMEHLPLVAPEVFTAAGPLLILAPHPDDESLGCGGLIAACCDGGVPPYVLIMTDGAGSHPNSRAYPPARLRAARQREAVAATTALGLPPGRIAFLGLPDTHSPVAGPAFDAAVTAVASLAIRIGAAALLATWQHDPHCDHESAHVIAATAAREVGRPHYAYPVWGWTLPPATPWAGPLPSGRRLDITAQLPRKRLAIAAHRTQYAGVIVDDPGAFQMQPAFMALFDRPYETYLEV